jgi:8-oxo-dGTP pyrophosphatase MutT (NUDIX family)
VLVDDRLLLLPTRDPDRPARLPWLELPGGGLEPGEGAGQAAVRELAEELGWDVDPGSVRPTGWRRSVVYPRHEGWVWQDEQVLLLLLPVVPDQWSARGRTPEERTAHGEPQWLSVAEVAAGGRFFPASLPQVLARVLAGGDVDEPVARFW